MTAEEEKAPTTTYLIDHVGENFVKPPVRMVGEDGNAFFIMAHVTRALKGIGRKDLADEYRERAMSGGDYRQLIALVYDYCDVDPDPEDPEEGEES